MTIHTHVLSGRYDVAIGSSKDCAKPLPPPDKKRDLPASPFVLQIFYGCIAHDLSVLLILIDQLRKAVEPLSLFYTESDVTLVR